MFDFSERTAAEETGEAGTEESHWLLTLQDWRLQLEMWAGDRDLTLADMLKSDEVVKYTAAQFAGMAERWNQSIRNLSKLAGK